MNEALSLEQLAETSRRQHPNSDVAVAVIADHSPDKIESATNKVMIDNVVEIVEAERANEKAQGAYEAETRTSGSIGRTSESLQLAAAESYQAEERLKAVQAKTEFAEQIGKVQKHLAKPMRLAATLLTALALGGGSTGVLVATEPDWNTYTRSANAKLGEKHYKNTYKRTTIILGSAMTLFGGLAGAVTGNRLTDREARRRARRIVAKEDQAS